MERWSAGKGDHVQIRLTVVLHDVVVDVFVRYIGQDGLENRPC